MKNKCCIAHRDIKIDNIILSKDGKMYLLADFGCSIILENENKRVFGFAGTESYLAPEVYENKIKEYQSIDYDPFAADVYSLAIVIL